MKNILMNDPLIDILRKSFDNNIFQNNNFSNISFQDEFDGFSFSNSVFGKMLTQPVKKH